MDSHSPVEYPSFAQTAKQPSSQAAKHVASGTVSKYAQVGAVEGFGGQPEGFQTSTCLVLKRWVMLYLQPPGDQAGPSAVVAPVR
jgi:hypothetical protein